MSRAPIPIPTEGPGPSHQGLRLVIAGAMAAFSLGAGIGAMAAFHVGVFAAPNPRPAAAQSDPGASQPLSGRDVFGATVAPSPRVVEVPVDDPTSAAPSAASPHEVTSSPRSGDDTEASPKPAPHTTEPDANHHQPPPSPRPED